MNFSANESMLKSILSDLDKALIAQARAKTLDENAIKDLLKQVDDLIVDDADLSKQMIDGDETTRDEIREWIEKTNSDVKKVLDKYKGKFTSNDKKKLEGLNKAVDKNKTNTFQKTIDEIDNAENGFKREDFADREKKAEKDYKEAKATYEKLKKYSQGYKNLGKSDAELKKEFNDIAGKKAAFGEWTQKLVALENVKGYDFKKAIEEINNEVMPGQKISPELTNKVKELQKKLSYIDLTRMDTSGHPLYSTATRTTIENIINFQVEKDIIQDDIINLMEGFDNESKIKNFTERAPELRRPDDLTKEINKDFMDEIEASDIFKLFSDDKKAIQRILDEKNKSVTDKFKEINEVFNGARKTLNILAKPDKDKAMLEAEIAVLKAEKKATRLEKEKPIAEAVAQKIEEPEEPEMSDKVEELERLGSEIEDLNQQILDEQEKLDALVEVQKPVGMDLDTTKIDLSDMGFANDFSVKDKRITTNNDYYDFGTIAENDADLMDAMVDLIYNEMKSKDATAFNNLQKTNLPTKYERRIPVLGRIRDFVSSHLPKNNGKSAPERQTENRIKDQIRAKLTDLNKEAVRIKANLDPAKVQEYNDYIQAKTEYEENIAAYERNKTVVEAMYDEKMEKDEYKTEVDEYTTQYIKYEGDRAEYETKKEAYDNSWQLNEEELDKFKAAEKRIALEQIKKNKDNNVDAKTVRDQAEDKVHNPDDEERQ